jgi:hypothetical protein
MGPGFNCREKLGEMKAWPIRMMGSAKAKGFFPEVFGVII